MSPVVEVFNLGTDHVMDHTMMEPTVQDQTRRTGPVLISIVQVAYPYYFI